MNATKFLHTQLLQPPPPQPLTSNTRHGRKLKLKLTIPKCTKDGVENTPAPDVEIRLRRGIRRRQKGEFGSNNDNNSNDDVVTKKKEMIAKKSWEEMSMSEKAIELYVGEKGALYWLNKFAYASIFIIIAAWIVFRFVGPAFNLYQLDSPPLAPESLFKG